MWLRGKFAFSSDISKFYNRLKLDPQHWGLQLAVWRKTMNPEENPDIYFLLSHFYGVKSSAGLLRVVTTDVSARARKKGLEEVAQAIEGAYVDDIGSSCDTQIQAEKVVADLKEHLRMHGLPVKGTAVTGRLPDETLSKDKNILIGGICWDSKEDMISLKTPEIFCGSIKKGKFSRGTRFLTEIASVNGVANFFEGYDLSFSQIYSKTSMLYDQLGFAAPLVGYGRHVTRQALINSEGDFDAPIDENIRALYFDYLYQVHCYGKMNFTRNKKKARNPKQAHLNIYVDAGGDAKMYVIHLLYETEVRGKFVSEFLTAANTLTKKGISMPHCELDAMYHAARAVKSIMVWLSEFVTSKTILSDSQIALFWLQSTKRKTSIFVNNRVGEILKTFKDTEIAYIRSEDNIADIGTKFGNFENAYKELGDDKPYRQGPKFMTMGVEQAFKTGTLVALKDLRLEQEKKYSARLSLLDFDPTGSDRDSARTPKEVILLAVNDIELGEEEEKKLISKEEEKDDQLTEDIEKRALEEKLQHTVASITSKGEEDLISRVDKDLITKMSARIEYSKYLYCPIKKGYNKFCNILTIVFSGLKKWMIKTVKKWGTRGEVKKQPINLKRAIENMSQQKEEGMALLLDREKKGGSMDKTFKWNTNNYRRNNVLDEAKRILQWAAENITKTNMTEPIFVNTNTSNKGLEILEKWCIKSLDERQETQAGNSHWMIEKVMTLTRMIISYRNESNRILKHRQDERKTGTATARKPDQEEEENIEQKLGVIQNASKILKETMMIAINLGNMQPRTKNEKKLYNIFEDDKILPWVTYPGVAKSMSLYKAIEEELTSIQSMVVGSEATEGIIRTNHWWQIMADIVRKAGTSSQASQILRTAVNQTKVKIEDEMKKKKVWWKKAQMDNVKWIEEQSGALLYGRQNSNTFRKAYSLIDIFSTSKDFREAAYLVAAYISRKVSAECLYFLTKPQIKRYGVMKNGILMARHRLFDVERITANQTEESAFQIDSLGVNKNPFLIETFSPIAWSIALYVHYRVSATNQGDNSTNYHHRGWVTCSRASIEFGIIIRPRYVFSRIERTCIICTKRKGKTAKQPYGPLHHAQVGARTPFSVAQIDLLGSYKLGPDKVPHYAFIAVCPISKITFAQIMEGKKVKDILQAINILFTRWGRVRNLLVDTEGGLLKLARKAMTKVSGELLRHQGTPIEVVSAHGHWPRGLVEARAKVIGTALGRLDKSKETISATELQYQLELVVSHLNDTPYALKRQSKLPGIHQLEQDVLLDTICPNTWRIGGRSDWNAPARMELVTDVEIQVQESVKITNTMEKFYWETLFPMLVQETDLKRNRKAEKIAIGNVIAFWPDGEKKEKQSRPHLGIVEELHIDDDGGTRKATIRYCNSNKTKIEAGKLCHKNRTTIRQCE